MEYEKALPKLLRCVRVTDRGCWEWKRYCEAGGYGRTRWNNQNILAHRLSWLAHKGPIPDGLLVCHVCDNPPCINPAHLFLGTHRDNYHDMRAKGRERKGLGFGSKTQRQRKLTHQQVDEILSSPESSAVLAARFGCSYTNVYMIRRGLRKTAPRK